MSADELVRIRELRYISRIAKLESDKTELELQHFIQLCLLRQGVEREAKVNLDSGLISF